MSINQFEGNLDLTPLETDLNNELIKSEDKYLRIYAEFENYKKRIKKEKEELINDTKISMISSIIDIDNDISIAIKNIQDDITREGVKLIASKLQKFLKSHDIEPIQTDKYDNNLHEVISIVNTGKNGIVDVISKGYTLHGKPFRYPKIILSK